MKTRKLKINVSGLRGSQVGAVINIPVDSDGVPLNSYWRQRIRDAKTDNCCEFIEEKKKTKKKEVENDGN